MAAQTKFQDFIEQVCKGVHHFHAAGDVMKAMLVNSPAPVATNTVKADLTEISAGNGYTAGGADVQNDVSETTGTASITAVDVVLTASGGAFGPFRYVVFYNDTATSPADALVSFVDYGSSISINDTESLTIDFGATWFTAT
jgi:hypothetical protein